MLVDIEGGLGAAAGTALAVGDSPFLVAALRLPVGALIAKAGIEVDKGNVRIKQAVRDQNPHVAMAAPGREVGVERDPVVAAGVEVVDEVLASRAKSCARRKI